MRKIVVITLFLLSSISFYPQNNEQTFQYYIEIPDLINVPIVDNQGKNVILTFSDQKLTNLFAGYDIKEFKVAFPESTTPLLQTVYIIECEAKLIGKIMMEYSSYFPRSEKLEPVKLLYIPNDMGGVNNTLPQSELAFVKAPLAWDISHAENVIVGIAELTNPYHEELINKTENVLSADPSTSYVGHGSQVAIVAAGNTDNNIGMASIGFNAQIKSSGAGYSSIIPLVNRGVRVINMSWGSCSSMPLESQYGQLIMDEAWNRGVVLVAAAGNGGFSCSSGGPKVPHYPAGLNHVISVTAVGHRSKSDNSVDGNREDVFENFNFGINNGYGFTTTFNSDVDLSAPGYDILSAADIITDGYAYTAGTSFAAPMVTGAIALMLGANPCLFPVEIESILKLTAVKNDTISQNLPYLGQIGAGRLNAYKAVEMAKNMQLPFGTVEVKDRIIDRWDFNFVTSPYKIELSNNLVTQNSTIKFHARNNIEILSGDYLPNEGFVDLQIIDIVECNTVVQNIESKIKKKIKNSLSGKSIIYPNPNNGNFTISLANESKESIAIDVFDVFGKSIYQSKTTEETVNLDLPNLNSGVYFVKLTSLNRNETLKFIKQ